MKKTIIFALFALFSGSKMAAIDHEVYEGPYGKSQVSYYKALDSKPWATVAKKHINELGEEKEALMAEFFGLLGITSQDWQAQLLANKDTFISDEKAMVKSGTPIDSGHLKQAFDSVLNYIDIEGSSVEIVDGVDGDHGCAMEAAHTKVLIDKNEIEYLRNQGLIDERALKGAMAHEVQHLLHSDSLTYCLMEGLLEAYQVDITKSKDFLDRFSTFKEKRADMMAALSDPELAQGLADFLALLSEGYKDSQGTEIQLAVTANYPKPSERVAYLRNIHDEMVQSQQV